MNLAEIEYFKKLGITYSSTIAAGAYGVIFKVYVQHYKSEFALKKIPIKMFNKTEINCLLSIDDPNIVHLYAIHTLNDYIYLLMELCPSDLDRLIKYKKFITPTEVKRYSLNILKSLNACHERKIAHCDIKPSNFLIDKYDRLKIADFGLSSIAIEQENSAYFKGTMLFMAPEIFTNHVYDPFAADIWSIGVTIYYIATRKFPFFSPNSEDLKEMIIDGYYDQYLVEDEALREVISRCLDLNPKTRATVRELMEMEYFATSSSSDSVSQIGTFMRRSNSSRFGNLILKPKPIKPSKNIAPISSLTTFKPIIPYRVQIGSMP